MSLLAPTVIILPEQNITAIDGLCNVRECVEKPIGGAIYSDVIYLWCCEEHRHSFFDYLERCERAEALKDWHSMFPQ